MVTPWAQEIETVQVERRGDKVPILHVHYVASGTVGRELCILDQTMAFAGRQRLCPDPVVTIDGALGLEQHCVSARQQLRLAVARLATAGIELGHRLGCAAVFRDP